MRMLLRAALTFLLVGIVQTAVAAPYPEKPLWIVIPYPPAGVADYFARFTAHYLTERWAQQVIVDSKPGAGGNIASDFVAKSKPDGYTLLLGTSGTNAVSPSLFTKMPYDARKDLVLVATVATTANVLVASPKKPFHSVKELIAYAKMHPGALTFASSGNGSVLHLSGELLKTMAGIDMLHVPYKGNAPALLDVLSGRVDFMVANAPDVVGQIKSHALNALAVTGTQRAAALPNVPTMSEAGVPGYNLSSWFGVFAPSGTPPTTVNALNAEINRMLELPDTRAQFASQGAEPLIMRPEQSARFFHQEIDKWGEVVKISGAKVDY